MSCKNSWGNIATLDIPPFKFVLCKYVEKLPGHFRCLEPIEQFIILQGMDPLILSPEEKWWAAIRVQDCLLELRTFTVEKIANWGLHVHPAEAIYMSEEGRNQAGSIGSLIVTGKWGVSSLQFVSRQHPPPSLLSTYVCVWVALPSPSISAPSRSSSTSSSLSSSSPPWPSRITSLPNERVKLSRYNRLPIQQQNSISTFLRRHLAHRRSVYKHHPCFDMLNRSRL